MTDRSPQHATDNASWLIWLTVLAVSTAASFFCLSIYGALFGVAFAALCLVLAKTDLEHFVLPDWANLLVFLLGLFWVWVTSQDPGAALSEAVLKSVVAAGLLYSVGAIYQLVRGHSGLGLGDVKLVAAASPWITSSQMLTTILVAAVAGIILATLRSLSSGKSLDERIPFGALLAPTIWLVWFAGEAQLVWFEG